MFEKIDSYERFINTFHIDEEKLYLYGINDTIWPAMDKVPQHWDDLKKRIFNNGVVSIRGYGQEAKGTALYLGLYKHLFNNTNVKKDLSNNMEPQKIISHLTGYKRNVNLFNYQVSHIFGKTKNIFLFEAPWNIALVPKIIDPFTGHETKGRWPVEYQKRFTAHVNEKYADYIEEYNQLITRKDIVEGIQEYIDGLKEREGPTKIILRFEKDVLRELSPIERTVKKENIPNYTSNIGYKEKPLPVYSETFDNSEEVYQNLLKLKHGKHRSWVQLRKGCFDYLGLEVSFTTKPVKSTSRAFAKDIQRKTGLSFNEILNLLNERQLGLI